MTISFDNAFITFAKGLRAIWEKGDREERIRYSGKMFSEIPFWSDVQNW